MVKIKNANVFGRIGSGIGKGLAEQVPKEIERSRLSSGLKELAAKKDLTPFEQFAELSAIPGATPQMIESGTKLLREQGLRNNFAKAAGRGLKQEKAFSTEQQQIPQGRVLEDVQFANLDKRKGAFSETIKNTDFVSPMEQGQPQILEKNPLRPEAVPALPWTQERRIEELADLQQKFPNATQEQLMQMASDAESRELALPKAVQEQDEYFRTKQKEAESAFTSRLEELLQKEGTAVYGDLTGTTLANLKRSMAADLRANPKATIEDVSNKWAQKGYQLGQTKTQLKDFASRDITDKIFKGKEAYDKLKTYSKIFKDTGNSEEFYNILKDKGPGGFSMSPQGAAYVAYDRSKPVQEYIDNTKNQSLLKSFVKPKISSTQRAIDVSNKISPDDSLLAIAKDLKEKDLTFNEAEFFNELGRDLEKFNPRQQREIASGKSDVFADWGDLWILPGYRGP